MFRTAGRFLRDNQQGDDAVPLTDVTAGVGGESDAAELICRVPDEILFQLQQIHDAVEGNITGTAEAASSSNVDSAPLKTPSKVRAFCSASSWKQSERLVQQRWCGWYSAIVESVA